MRGMAQMWVAVLALVVVGVLYVGSYGIPGVINPACHLLLPQYCNYECLEKSISPITYTDADGYGCNIGTHCVDFYCAYPNQVGGSRCTITSEVDTMFIQIGTNTVQQLNSGQSVTAAHGELVKTSRLGGGIRFRSVYLGKYLKWSSHITGQIETVDGCDHSSMNVGYDEYLLLPSDAQFAMEPGQSQNYICGFDDFPLLGNFATYGSQEVICKKNGDTSATLYGMEYISTKGAGCYYYPGAVVASVQCCPNDQFGTQTCGNDFKWTSGDVGCCMGGICSPFNCPGEGGWDYDACTDPPCDIYKYTCSSTGQCVVSDTKNIDCYYDSDCTPGLQCNRGTNKCVSKIVPVTCTAAGHECCSPGMFAPNVGLRTCQDAGFGEDYICVNGECLDTGPGGECNWWCQFLASLALIIVGLVIGFIITLALALIKVRFLLLSPVMFVVVWLAISIGLILLFATPLALIGGMIA